MRGRDDTGRTDKDIYDCRNQHKSRLSDVCGALFILLLTTGVQTKTSDIYLKTKSIDDTSDFIAKEF